MLASGLSTLVCVAMLIGSTFAWFTDSVSNNGNRIEAGTLDIDLLMDKTGNGTYTSIADGTGDIFSEATGNGLQWEPGKTQIVYLAVRNKGSLALNYNILLDVINGTPGLIGSLEYAVLDGAKATDLNNVTNWEDLKKEANTNTGLIKEGRTPAAPNGTLDEVANNTKDETDYFALAVHMREDAGNEYQGGSITINVTLTAKQATAETDSFGNQYDKDATFKANTPEQLVTAVADAKDGDTVELTSAIKLEKPLDINKDITMDGNGNAIISERAVNIGSTNNVTLKNITFTAPNNLKLTKSEPVNNASSIYATHYTGTLTIDGCTFIDAPWDSLQIVPAPGATISITNNTFANTIQGYRYVHVDVNTYDYTDEQLDTIKVIMTGNTFKNVTKDYVKDSAITIFGVFHKNGTYTNNTYTGAGADEELTTSIVWISDGDVLDNDKLLDPDSTKAQS